MTRAPARTLACLAALCAGAARGADPPPPDPAAGERSDGRRPQPDVRASLLEVPRLMLAVPRVLLRGLAAPMRWGLDLEEKYRIYDRVIDALSWDHDRMGLRLAFDFALDFRPLVGLSFFADHARGSSGNYSAKLLTGGENLVQAALHGEPRGSDRLQLDAAYLRRDDQVFHGIGSIPGGDRGAVRYRIDAFDLGMRGGWRPTSILSIDLSGSFAMRRFGDGHRSGDPPITERYCERNAVGRCIVGTVDETLVPGFATGTQLVRTGLDIVLDTRSSPSRPSSGLLIDLGADYSHGLAEQSSYFRVGGSIAASANLYRGSHVLVLRIASQLVLPTGDAAVPFSELAILGGPDSLRGFRAGRFHDYSSLIGTVEYRWPIWIWADGTLFADYGGTFGERYEGLAAATLFPDVGAGIRIRTSEHVLMRFQVAYGFPDGWQVYLSLQGG